MIDRWRNRDDTARHADQHSRFWNWMIRGGLALSLLGTTFQPCFADDVKRHGDPKVESKLESSRFHQLGSQACARCHTRALAEDQQPDSQGRRRVDFILLNEYGIWKEHDRHAQAGLALQSERGRRMAEFLEIDTTNPAAGCVQCHAPVAVADERDAKDMTATLTEGVSGDSK